MFVIFGHFSKQLFQKGIHREDAASVVTVMDTEQAKKSGALALFGEKYADLVSVYYIGLTDDIRKAFSKEFCGGPHVEHTLQVGSFKISKQEAVGAGARRIKFVIN